MKVSHACLLEVTRINRTWLSQAVGMIQSHVNSLLHNSLDRKMQPQHSYKHFHVSLACHATWPLPHML